MALGNATEEIAKATKIQSRTDALRKRFEDDYELHRLDKFTIPKEEGEWENFTTNKPAADSNKIIDTLSDSKVKIWIPIGDESEEERKNLSLTEQFVYGAISLRDSIYQTVPEVLPLHPSMCWFPVVRGWLCLRTFLYEDDDGKVIPDIAVWDPLNTYWISGSRGIMWACYKRFATVEDVNQQYNIKASENKDGKVELYDIFDGEEEGVAIGDEWVKKDPHDIGHPPVLILPVGSKPLIQSGRHDDTIKDMGESFAVNNREIYKVSSRLNSYWLTIAGRVAKTPEFVYYDSDAGGLPPELEKNPYEKGAVIFLDKAKGQERVQGSKPELTRDVYAFKEAVDRELSIGGMGPISFGQQPYPQTAAGTNIMAHASMTNMSPFMNAIQTGYKWLAHELVSQFKSGGFEKLELQGMDGSNRRFRIEVTPDQIDDKWNFEAELTPDMPQDELANIGMAVQAVEADLMSRQSARDKYHLADNTDLEQTLIDREKIFRIAAISMRKVAADLADPEKYNDPEAAQYILDAIQEMDREKGVASQPGVTKGVRPSADTTAVSTQPGAMERFFGKFRRGGE